MVLTHLDYVAAVAGVEGHSKQMHECDRVGEKLLATIVSVREKMDGGALRAEAGLWSMVSRTRMLQFRFFTKLTCAAAHTTNARVLLVSARMAGTPKASGCAPGRLTAASLWSFVKRCWRTAELFTDDSVPATCVSLQAASIALHPTRALVRIERLHPGGGGRNNDVWRSVDVHTPDEPHQYLRLHSTSERGAQSINYADNSVSTKWAFTKAGVGIRQAVGEWSNELRLAAHASLRRRANVFRTRHSSELPRLHRIWAKPRKAMRDFLCLQAGSCMGWWWRLPDVQSARRLQKARIGEWGNEDTYRRSPHKKTCLRPGLPRLEDPAQRVCYLCKHASAAQRRPETIAHLYTECVHAQLVECRSKVRAQFRKTAQSASEIGGGGVAVPLVPDLDDDVVQAAAQVGGPHRLCRTLMIRRSCT
jgi:hypothetical protein